MGIWIDTQKANYPISRYIMSNLNIRTLWEEFVNSEEYKAPDYVEELF